MIKYSLFLRLALELQLRTARLRPTNRNVVGIIRISGSTLPLLALAEEVLVIRFSSFEVHAALTCRSSFSVRVVHRWTSHWEAVLLHERVLILLLRTTFN